MKPQRSGRSNNSRNKNNNYRNNRGASNRNYHNNRRPQQGAGQRRRQSAEEQKFLAGTAVDPFPRIVLEKGSDKASMRAFDLICPIGMGQRGLIVASPGLGKTTLLKDICQSVSKGYPDMQVYCLLIDERPEEVTDFKRTVDAEVFSSSIDMDHENHIKTANTLMDKAFKDASEGKNVMILLDSLTRLARVHNNQSNGPRGRTLSGGVDANALSIPRKIFGAARNVEEMGSITILATILVDTGSRMDDVIFEEFKGTGNMEVVLSKELAGQRIFPAIDPSKSNTRRAHLLFEDKIFDKLELLRRGLAQAQPSTAMQKLLKMISESKSNEELLNTFNK